MKHTYLPLILLITACTVRPSQQPAQTTASDETATSTTPRGQETALVEAPTETATATSTPEQPQITWSSIGPGGGGWLTSLAFAPPNTIFVGCDVGGVYRSVDGGETFEIINTGLRNYVVLTIAVHPDEPSTVFLGTAGGLYKSTDSGDHWNWMRAGFPAIEQFRFSAPITSLAIDPTNPEIMYAGSGDSNQHRFGQGMIYKSEDSGEHWSAVGSGSSNLHPNAIIYSILIHPQDSNTLFASTDYGVYKSTDGGVNWETKNDGLPHTRARKLVMDPTDPNVLYLTINANPNEHPWRGGVYKSVDGGETWQPKTSGLGKHVGQPGQPDLITANYENILIDLQNPDVLYVGAISWWDAGIYKTSNGGDSWSNVISSANADKGWISYQDWGNPQGECMLIDPTNPQRVFFGDSMELFRTEDGGGTWQQIYTNQSLANSGRWQGRGLETTVLYDIEVDPTDSNVVYFGFWDIGLHKSEDGGKTFKRFTQGLAYPGNIFDMEIDPDSPNVIYASSGRWEWIAGDIVKSEDHGQTWRVIGNTAAGLPDSQVYALVLDPTSPEDSRTLYAASYRNGVFKSTDGGMHWLEMNSGLGANGNLLVSSLVMNPTDSNVLYAGVDMEEAWLGVIEDNQHGGVYRTTDGGVNWVKVSRGMPNVLGLSISPHDPQTIFAATRGFWDNVNQRAYEGGVYRSMDAGESWDLVFEDPFVRLVVVDPHDPEVVYAGTGDNPYHDQSTGNGLFQSVDGGETWYPVNQGLSHLSIMTLEIDPLDPSVLYLGTGGNGIFKGALSD